VPRLLPARKGFLQVPSPCTALHATCCGGRPPPSPLEDFSIHTIPPCGKARHCLPDPSDLYLREPSLSRLASFGPLDARVSTTPCNTRHASLLPGGVFTSLHILFPFPSSHFLYPDFFFFVPPSHLSLARQFLVLFAVCGHPLGQCSGPFSTRTHVGVFFFPFPLRMSLCFPVQFFPDSNGPQLQTAVFWPLDLTQSPTFNPAVFFPFLRSPVWIALTGITFPPPDHPGHSSLLLRLRSLYPSLHRPPTNF